MSKRILLMTPPYHTGIIEITGKWPPLSLVYLAGHLRNAGHQVEIYDSMTKDHTLEDIHQKLLANPPEVVMIGAFTASINAALEVLALVKRVSPQIKTILGGVHATYCYQEILEQHGDYIDFIVCGEGEITAVELMGHLDQGTCISMVAGIAYRDNGQIVKTGERPLMEELDDLIPAWDLLHWEDYHYRITNRRLAVIASSRGCTHQCSFCSQHRFWHGKYRERSAESMVEEIEMLHQRYGVGMFMFGDEYTTYNGDKWEKFLDLLIEKNLDIHISLETRVDDILRDRNILYKYRQAGIIHVYVGVESVKQEVLDQYKKELTVEQSKEAIHLLNQAEILTECSFILGDLHETKESIAYTLNQAMEYNPDLAHFLLVMPWPHTEYYEEVKDHIVEWDFSKYHLVHPIIKPLNMETSDLWDELINCFRVFYMDKYGQYMQEPDSFKKRYMIKSMQLMVKEFFSKNFGDIPIH